MYDIGRVCVKIAGRDAGKFCVIVDEKDGRVMVDGQTRRRFVNPTHLEPTQKTTGLKKGATHANVVTALGKLDITVVEYKKRGGKKASTSKPGAKTPAKKAPAKKTTKKTTK